MIRFQSQLFFGLLGGLLGGILGLSQALAEPVLDAAFPCQTHVDSPHRKMALQLVSALTTDQLTTALNGFCASYVSLVSKDGYRCLLGTSALGRQLSVLAWYPPTQLDLASLKADASHLGSGMRAKFDGMIQAIRSSGRQGFSRKTMTDLWNYAVTEAGGDLHQAISLALLPLNSLRVISFYDDLEKMVLSGEMTPYFERLKEAVAAADRHEARFNLWDFTLVQAGGDRAKALKWIAVLFQYDFVLEPASILRAVNGDSRKDQLLLYVNAGMAMRDAAKDPDNRDWISFYPPGVQSADRGYYHFYVIAYLASQLARNPEIGPKMGAFSAIMLNSHYEYAGLRIAPGERTVMENLLRAEPNRIDARANPHSLEDLYLGYAGALWSTGRATALPSQESFNQEFSASPNAFLRKLLK